MFGGTFSILHWIVVLAVVLLLFGGRGKVSAIMGDFGKGLRNFKTGLKGSEEEEAEAMLVPVAQTILHLRGRHRDLIVRQVGARNEPEDPAEGPGVVLVLDATALEPLVAQVGSVNL